MLAEGVRRPWMLFCWMAAAYCTTAEVCDATGDASRSAAGSKKNVHAFAIRTKKSPAGKQDL